MSTECFIVCGVDVNWLPSGDFGAAIRNVTDKMDGESHLKVVVGIVGEAHLYGIGNVIGEFPLLDAEQRENVAAAKLGALHFAAGNGSYGEYEWIFFVVVECR